MVFLNRNKENTNEHAELDRQKPMRHQPHTMNYRQLSKTVNGRGCPVKAIPENVQTSHIIWAQRVIFRNKYAPTNTNIHVIKQLMKKHVWGGLESRKGQGEML